MRLGIIVRIGCDSCLVVLKSRPPQPKLHHPITLLRVACARGGNMQQQIMMRLNGMKIS